MLKAVGTAVSAIRFMNVLRKAAIASAVAVCGIYAVKIIRG